MTIGDFKIQILPPASDFQLPTIKRKSIILKTQILLPASNFQLPA